MSAAKRRAKAFRRSRWVAALAVRADNLLGRGLPNVDEYGCRHCGAVMASVGGFTTEDDWDALRYFDEEIDRHESGGCKPPRQEPRRRLDVSAMPDAGRFHERRLTMRVVA